MRISILLTALLVAATLRAQDSVSGFLMLDSQRFDINFIAAALVPDPFDKTHTKLRIRVLMADRAFDPDLITEAAHGIDLKQKGYHGLEFEVTQDKGIFSLSVISNTLKSSIATSGTFDASQLAVLSRQRIQAHLSSRPDKIAGVSLSYDVKFAAGIAPIEVPTASDRAAAAQSPSAIAYLALHDAIMSNDKQRFLDSMPPDRRAVYQNQDISPAMSMAVNFGPRNVEVLKAAETGDRARLLIRSADPGQPSHRGIVRLKRIDGRWYLDSESWDLN